MLMRAKELTQRLLSTAILSRLGEATHKHLLLLLNTALSLGCCAGVSMLPTLAGGQGSKDQSGEIHTQLAYEKKR